MISSCSISVLSAGYLTQLSYSPTYPHIPLQSIILMKKLSPLSHRHSHHSQYPVWHLKHTRAARVVQWLRIYLPKQGTRVRALVWEDPTCRGATKPVCHNYWACALQPVSHNYWAHMPQLLKPVHLEPVLRNKRSHCSEKPAHRNKE